MAGSLAVQSWTVELDLQTDEVSSEAQTASLDFRFIHVKEEMRNSTLGLSLIPGTWILLEDDATIFDFTVGVGAKNTVQRAVHQALKRIEAGSNLHLYMSDYKQNWASSPFFFTPYSCCQFHCWWPSGTEQQSS